MGLLLFGSDMQNRSCLNLVIDHGEVKTKKNSSPRDFLPTCTFQTDIRKGFSLQNKIL